MSCLSPLPNQTVWMRDLWHSFSHRSFIACMDFWIRWSNPHSGENFSKFSHLQCKYQFKIDPSPCCCAFKSKVPWQISEILKEKKKSCLYMANQCLPCPTWVHSTVYIIYWTTQTPCESRIVSETQKLLTSSFSMYVAENGVCSHLNETAAASAPWRAEVASSYHCNGYIRTKVTWNGGRKDYQLKVAEGVAGGMHILQPQLLNLKFNMKIWLCAVYCMSHLGMQEYM